MVAPRQCMACSTLGSPAGRLAAVALVAVLMTCSDATDPAASTRFVFRDPATNSVVQLRISNGEGLEQAEALLQSGAAMWALGTPRRGDGGFNAPFTWHIDPATVTFAEVTIEACQVSSTMIADDLDYWINFGQVCIWGVVESRAN
jgi:hypothetical protein